MEKIAAWIKKEVLGQETPKPKTERTFFALRRDIKRTVQEAVDAANRRGATLCSNRIVDEMLEDQWKHFDKKPRHPLDAPAYQDKFKNLFPVWTGTLVTYV